MVELAHVVVDICLTVPKGILCFVSSYNVLNILKKSIENHKHILYLQARKVCFFLNIILKKIIKSFIYMKKFFFIFIIKYIIR